MDNYSLYYMSEGVPRPCQCACSLQERAIKEVKKLQDPNKAREDQQQVAPPEKRKVKGRRRKRGRSKWERMVRKAFKEAEDNDLIELTANSTG